MGLANLAGSTRTIDDRHSRYICHLDLHSGVEPVFGIIEQRRV